MSAAAQGSAVYAFTDDFVDAGPQEVAKSLSAMGFSGVSLATVYHAARDLLPHNPRRAVAHRGEGAHYFPPAEQLYTGPFHPAAAPSAGEFGAVIGALAANGLTWQAWTVYLHNGRLAEARPEFAVVNAFGDRYLTDLCPSSEEVAAYANQLTADVAALSPPVIVAESLHHAGFSHGYHHERAFVDLPPVGQFLLSLCFCGACTARAAKRDIDADEVAARVRDTVRGMLSGDSSRAAPTLDRESLRETCGASISGYLAAREETVVALAEGCAAVAHAAGAQFGFMDQTGALKGYVTGDPQGPACAEDAWQLGIDPLAVARAVDSYVVLAYAQRPERVLADIGSYSAAIAGQAELRCVLRHGAPDMLNSANLLEKAQAARAHGAAVDFYHYGLMPLSGLTAAALAATATRGAAGAAAGQP